MAVVGGIGTGGKSMLRHLLAPAPNVRASFVWDADYLRSRVPTTNTDVM